MAIELLDHIEPVSGFNYFLLNDSYLKGGFHVVNTKAELEAMPTSVVKLGMWVAVHEESGKIYECTKAEYAEDEFGDTVVVTEFTPISLESIPAPRSGYVRPTQHIDFSYVSPKEARSVVLDLGCKSFILASLSISASRKMKIQIFGTTLKTDAMPYTFDSSRKNFDDGSTYLKNRSRFQYRKFNIMTNLENTNNTKFTFSCSSLEDSKYYLSKRFNTSKVFLDFSFIPLEPRDL